ncbi:MAG TPA: 4Fe-4S binding protein [Nitrospirota bacterium]|nr:4Fe-4S binding protein [Nitrospirota bacterium]
MPYRIAENRCSGCGSCRDVCPSAAIKMQDGHAVITIECIGCGACPRVCSEGAITQVLTTTVQNSF